jgi:hypothetical protein
LSFLNSGSKPSERHSFTSLTCLGARSSEFFLGSFELLAFCFLASKSFKSCGSCQWRETRRGGGALAAFCGADWFEMSGSCSTGGTYTISTFSASAGVSQPIISCKRSALLPTTTGKTTSAGCGAGDFFAAAAIAQSPARQTTLSATVLITGHAPTRREHKASRWNQPRIRLRCWFG